MKTNEKSQTIITLTHTGDVVHGPANGLSLFRSTGDELNAKQSVLHANTDKVNGDVTKV